MSELIDRIYDVAKISKEVADVTAEIAKTTASIDGFKKAVEGLNEATRKAKGTEELTKNSKLLNDIVVQGGVEMKRYEAEVVKLKEKTEQLSNSEKAAAIEIAKARIELQAAQKATKEAAIAEIELTAANGKLSTSYNALDKDLKAAKKAYKDMEEAERTSAKGQELLKKIDSTQKMLKDMDKAMGDHQRSVGDYAIAVKRLPGIFGEMQEKGQSIFVTLREKWAGMKDVTMSAVGAIEIQREAMAKAMHAAEAAAIAEQKLKEAKAAGAATSALAAEAETARAAATTAGTVATEASSAAMKIFKYALLSTGIGALVVALGAVVTYFAKTNEGAKEFAKISAGVNAVMQSATKILGSYGKLLFDYGKLMVAVVTFDKKGIEQGWKAFGDNIKKVGENIRSATGDIAENYKAGVQNTANQQMMAKKEREWSGQRLLLLKQYEEARFNAGKKSKLDDEGKIEAAKKAMKINETIFQNDLKIAKNKALMVENEQKLLSKKDYQAIQDSKNKVQEIINAHEMQQLTVDALMGKAEQRLEAGNDSEIKSEKEKNDKILEAKRKLFDMQTALMADSLKKDLTISEEAARRKIEDLKRNGEYTAQLEKTIREAQAIEAKTITDKWHGKELADQITADELKLSNMEKAGQDTLALQKEILEKKMQAEILAGGNEADIRDKYRWLEIDLENETADKKLAAFEKELTRRSELLQSAYANEELELKKRYAAGLMTREEYDKQLSEIQLRGLEDVNNQAIEALKEQLDNAELSDEKRAELSEKLKKLRIDNENAVTDATIKANEDQIKADQAAKEKRMEVAKALVSATTEIFGAIADFQTQKSEQKIAELEKEQEAIDAQFEKDQENLDNAIMSDETRAEKQKEINAKKAEAEKVLQDKIRAEKVKQAKWDKANNIVQAIAGTALAVINAMKTQPFIPLGLIAAGLAGTMGAIQLASIISTPIPAFEKGGVTGSGPALWGEARPEVAVTPSGDVILAEKPTISNFDAGTRIYKSVSDYEAAMSLKNGKGFEIDYDRMAAAMPKTSIELNGNGTFTLQEKRNQRRTAINRRTKLN